MDHGSGWRGLQPVGVGLVLWDDDPPVLAYLPGPWEDRNWKTIAGEEADARTAKTTRLNAAHQLVAVGA